jgi:hypothetical protein
MWLSEAISSLEISLCETKWQSKDPIKQSIKHRTAKKLTQKDTTQCIENSHIEGAAKAHSFNLCLQNSYLPQIKQLSAHTSIVAQFWSPDVAFPRHFLSQKLQAEWVFCGSLPWETSTGYPNRYPSNNLINRFNLGNQASQQYRNCYKQCLRSVHLNMEQQSR